MATNKFSFGKNWQAFINQYFNEERVVEAQRSLIEFVGKDRMEGYKFIDVGCGSGLFSLVAYRMEALKMFSFDCDGNSVAACKFLKEKSGNPAKWEVAQGSILDRNLISGLGKFDFVYCWGVLHHTGSLWQAVENTLSLVASGGLLYLAIYNKTEKFSFYPDGRFGTSRLWERIKRFYSSLPLFFQYAIDYCVITALVLLNLLRLHNSLKEITDFPRKHRGMSWRVDIRDWLGGYPYEYASVEEVLDFVLKRGFTLKNLRRTVGLGNNEFLFSRTQA